MLAKGTAKGVKPKGFAGAYRQGWISLPVIRCHKSNLPSLKDILVLCEETGTQFEERPPPTGQPKWSSRQKRWEREPSNESKPPNQFW